MPDRVREESVDDLATSGWTPGQLIDVRSPDEFAGGHVPGAVNVPLEDVLREPNGYGEGIVHVICRSGRRSLTAVDAMQAAGVAAVSVAGGTTAWSEAGRPIERPQATDT